MTADQNGPSRLSVVRIVTGALTAGLTSFAVIVWIIGRGRFEASSIAHPEPLWMLVLGGFATFALAGFFVVGRLLASQARSRHASSPLSDEEIVLELQRLTVLRAALIEGLGLVGCIAFLVAGQGMGLLIALACVIGLLLLFPTDGRYQSFRETLTRPE